MTIAALSTVAYGLSSCHQQQHTAAVRYIVNGRWRDGCRRPAIVGGSHRQNTADTSENWVATSRRHAADSLQHEGDTWCQPVTGLNLLEKLRIDGYRLGSPIIWLRPTVAFCRRSQSLYVSDSSSSSATVSPATFFLMRRSSRIASNRGLSAIAVAYAF